MFLIKTINYSIIHGIKNTETIIQSTKSIIKSTAWCQRYVLHILLPIWYGPGGVTFLTYNYLL